MHPVTALLAAEHLDDLRHEANSARLARLANQDRPARLAAWRRVLGRGTRSLSDGLGAVASRLDPDDCPSGPIPA